MSKPAPDEKTDYRNERELGLAMRECEVARETLFVTTKVHKGVANIAEAFDASLDKLGLAYVDLYLSLSLFLLVFSRERA